jgi:hypothetical protein
MKLKGEQHGVEITSEIFRFIEAHFGDIYRHD